MGPASTAEAAGRCRSDLKMLLHCMRPNPLCNSLCHLDAKPNGGRRVSLQQHVVRVEVCGGKGNVEVASWSSPYHSWNRAGLPGRPIRHYAHARARNYVAPSVLSNQGNRLLRARVSNTGSRYGTHRRV